jgi:hypothetical protein
MPTVITKLEQVTAAWLTATLREAGALPQGEVTSIEQRGNEAFNSLVAHLALRYSGAAPPSAPPSLLLKLNRDFWGETEVAFYNIVMAIADELSMLARCYSAALDTATGNSYCLLEDLSETHVPPVSRRALLAGSGVPSEAHLDGIVEALARFHAYWWEHPRLGQEELTQVRPWFRDHDYYQRHVQRREREWAQFKETVGDWFPTELRALYESVLARLPDLWHQYLEAQVLPYRHITMTNGDCYFSQFLCPLDPAQERTRIVDWQSASANFAAYDLAYLFPTFWTPAQRHEQAREERLLRRYHNTLVARGVQGYSWDDLMTDYRMMITFMLFDPVWNQTDGSPESYWWPKMQCLADAFKDLECAALLDTLRSNP